jgi:hypothetical protein
MFRPSRFLLLIFLLIGCGSESFTESEKDRAQLMNGFESYASRDEVMAKLNRGDAVKSVEQSSKHKSGQPPYQIYSARLPYEDRKEPGELLITFFNNRLMQMSFYPENLDRYLAALRSSGIELRTGSEVKNGHTAIWIGQDFDNKNYVGWADDRLRAQQRRWLSRYS